MKETLELIFVGNILLFVLGIQNSEELMITIMVFLIIIETMHERQLKFKNHIK